MKLLIHHDSQFQKNVKREVPSVVVALLAPGRICNILEVEKTLSSGPVSCLAPALRFFLLQLCKENIMSWVIEKRSKLVCAHKKDADQHAQLK